ncbi:mechanosensitive ion channel family protein [Alterisphingorhabdus coralli]|uniref:Mechanosensitive ion channel family protein n=1 Tax=Alterisphingorhabdus coralli TaxID=3071408 RepID=A0AA97F7D8_9SPHN|nr:mechanosensitive ion channel family protein [Parasphingorhabdus sp. SCSIO 66989]WOE74841.1 mechanosensitive ion channel family protein [Parasphingorhabdus sp. SCSIO 66989]
MQFHFLAAADPGLSDALDPDVLARMWGKIESWFYQHYSEILIAFLIGSAIYLALRFLRVRARTFAETRADCHSFPAIVGRTLSKTGAFFLLLVSIRLVTRFAATPEAIERVITFLFTIAAVIQSAIWLREIAIGLLERRASDSAGQGSETLGNALALIRILITIALFTVAAMVILDNLGVNITGLVAGLGIGGIAVGLAAQGIFSDLFAALSIIFDKPFKRGEFIGYDDTIAKVEKIGLKSTRLRSLTGEEVIISNTNLLDKEIVNYTRLERRRTRFAIGVVYQTPPDQARQIPGMLRMIVEDHGAEFVRSGFVGFGSSSIDFEIEFDIHNPDYEFVYNKRHAIGLEILQRFNEKGLEFAYPTQTTFTAAPDGKMVMPYPKDGFTVKPE